MVEKKPITSTKTDTQYLLTGPWLGFARAVWVFIFLLAVIVPALGFWGVFTTPPDQLFVFKETSAYRQIIAPLAWPLQLVVFIASVTVALALFTQRSNDLVILFTSITILTVIAGLGLSVTFVNPWNSAVYDLAARALASIGFISTIPTLVLFPNGRLPARWVFWFMAVWTVYHLLGIPFASLAVLEVSPIASIVIQFTGIGVPLYLMARNYRDAGNPQVRQQIRLALIGATATYLAALVTQVTGALMPVLADPVSVLEVVRVIFYAGRLIFLVLFTFALLRYRLWDIEFIINRSMVYGSLTFGLALVFAATLYALSFIIPGEQSLVALVITALVAGLSFQPVRLHLQKYVDQRFYHINIDYRPQRRETGAGLGGSAVEGESLKNYQNLRLIGKGGMAEVYVAERPTNREPVAIKLLPAYTSSDEAHVRRFLREGETLARLEHPNIVRVLDYGHEDQQYFIVMEYLHGKDLSATIKERGRLGVDEVRNILAQVADALDYSHGQGIVHRDLKPSNVMLLPEQGRVVLMDFGIAKLLNNQTLMTRTAVMGTFDYISPEQIEASADLDGRADIYSLGCMAYHMLAGEPPFKHSNVGGLLIAHMSRPAPNLRQAVPEVPESVAQAVLRAMEKKPERRFATASDFVAAWK